MKTKKNNRIIISGGGTGGHIFPALSIANELKSRDSGNEILFVGASGRMEMEKIPAAGYRIIGLPVRGFNRKNLISNLGTIFKILQSVSKAKEIIEEFKPDVVIGVGGYASGPMLRVAGKKGIPTLLQEQNSYAGITNRMLAKRAKTICVAYQGMEKYFPGDKIVITGNPVRKDFVNIRNKTHEAFEYFNIMPGKKVLLILGGSLGAATINQSIMDNIRLISENHDLEIIWQTGNIYHEYSKSFVAETNCKNLKLFDFIERMDLAYDVADAIISRAGAGTISELCIVGKPVILVPSPNVAEDHQTKNAMSLVSRNAGIMVSDGEAVKKLIPEAIRLLNNNQLTDQLATNIKMMAITNASERIVDEIYKLI
ncbi:MAG TPA: undecaprenyldiphospho-muramoylpentapeptide beta-N-acetylglucosaminyltransferase [Bacteroidales bacterium]|nr:undecaprenyldiphospho-muramoylpentapeptide beta-N-acetylglucosaminyltransferase [Bacteroidales bacterium]